MMPANMQTSQEGKKEPRMLNVGTRLHPGSPQAALNVASKIVEHRKRFTETKFLSSDQFALWPCLWLLHLEEVSRSEGQIGGLQQKPCSREDIFGARLGQHFLR